MSYATKSKDNTTQEKINDNENKTPSSKNDTKYNLKNINLENKKNLQKLISDVDIVDKKLREEALASKTRDWIPNLELNPSFILL